MTDDQILKEVAQSLREELHARKDKPNAEFVLELKKVRGEYRGIKTTSSAHKSLTEK